jgi:hypothetical protein
VGNQKEQMMKRSAGWPLLLACGSAVVSGAWAQASDAAMCPKTRAEVRAECVAFLKTHRWDEQVGDYVLKSGVKPPEGVATREEVRAERDKFFRANRWDETKGLWVPVKGEPRDTSKMSRAEVQKETAAFVRTHHWDEIAGAYVDNPKK